MGLASSLSVFERAATVLHVPATHTVEEVSRCKLGSSPVCSPVDGRVSCFQLGTSADVCLRAWMQLGVFLSLLGLSGVPSWRGDRTVTFLRSGQHSPIERLDSRALPAAAASLWSGLGRLRDVSQSRRVRPGVSSGLVSIFLVTSDGRLSTCSWAIPAAAVPTCRFLACPLCLRVACLSD